MPGLEALWPGINKAAGPHCVSVWFLPGARVGAWGLGGTQGRGDMQNPKESQKLPPLAEHSGPYRMRSGNSRTRTCPAPAT